MKKSNFMLLAAAALAMSSCANEEIDSINGKTEANAITFAATSTNNSGTRADIITPTNLTSTTFDVMARTSSGDNNIFIGTDRSGVRIQYNTSSSSWEYANADDLAYWPSDGTKLDFYAFSPFFTDATGSTTGGYKIYPDIYGGLGDGSNKLIEYQDVDEYAEGATAKNYDLMYATAFNYDKTVNSSKVKLTFRHALSQVVFKARTAKSALDVEVASVKVHNLKTGGNFNISTTFATGETHYAEAATRNNWETNDEAYTRTAKLNATAVTANTTAVDLSEMASPLLVIPQVVTAWTTAVGAPVAITDADANKQGYLEITMKLKQNGQYIIGSADAYTTVYVPFGGTDWQPGKRYIYTLVFGGGYDADGNPVLSPIYFEPEVEDWVDADQGEMTF